MIDVYNNAGTESYGCFKHLKAAKPTLKRLGEAGVQSVTVSSFSWAQPHTGISCTHGRGLPYHQNATDADTGGIA